MNNSIDLQDYSNLQLLIHFDKADAKVVTQYQKIDPVLKAMSHSFLLAKNYFRSAVLTNQSIPLPIDEPNKEVDVSMDLFVPPLVGELDEEADEDFSPVDEPDEEVDVSTDLFIPLPVGKPNEEADKDIYLFCHFIENVLWLIFSVVKVSQNYITRSIIDSLESNHAPCAYVSV